MEYRTFGRLDWKVSALGFGTMRLPTTDGGPRSRNIDEAESIRMIRHAIDEGVNYVDTAYPYHDGASETVLGKAIEGGYRQKVMVADKLPLWMIQSEADFDRLLNEQLRRLSTDCIDFYLLHAINQSRWRNVVLKYNLLEKANAAIRDGRIRYLGFSFHDRYPTFAEVVEAYDAWTFCQIQYNYMDTENQAGVKGLKLAASKGLAVVIMEPLLGGRLASPPASIREAIERCPIQRSPANWGLQWIWDQPEVSVVLSGMNNMAQVKENLEAARRSRIHSFGSADFEMIEQLQRKYRERATIPCTQCNYCMPCPNGVDIPSAFDIYNDAFLHEDVTTSRFKYLMFLGKEKGAGACIACQTCEAQCPQAIPISEWMPKVQALLG